MGLLPICVQIQFPKLVTSYAVPPQSSFSCPPLSLRIKSTATSISKRRTYCAIDGPEAQIQCFSQESDAGNQHTGTISASSFLITDTNSPTVFMDLVPTTATTQDQDGSFDVVVVHKDGRVRRLAHDLAIERWNTMTMGSQTAGAQEIQAGSIAGFEEARKGLLRKRPDLVAMILGDRASATSENPSILILVSHPGQKKAIVPGDVRVHLFSVPAHVPANSLPSSEAQRLRPLTTFNLPNLQGAEMLDSRRVHWNANLGSGELSVSFDSGFISYDLSQYTPEVSSHLLLGSERFSSLMRITPRAVIAAGQSSIAVYNTQYRSVQAELPLSEALSATSAKQETTTAAFEFISHSPKLAVAVAACGFNLVAFDLESFRQRDSSHRKARGSLLIDAIGKGVAHHEPEVQRSHLGQNATNYVQPLGHTRIEDSERWAETRSELDAAVKAQNPVQFDSIVKSQFGKQSAGTKKFPLQKEFVDPEKISYLLSTIFSLKTDRDGSTGPKLVLSFWPRETFQWLMSTGCLSSGNVHAALRKAALPRVLPPLPHDALVQALADHHKGSIKLLLQIIRSPVQLGAFELATALRIILDFARFHSSNSSDAVPRTLTEAPHKPDEPTQEVTVTRGAEDKPPSQESESAVTNAIMGLNLTLTRLHSQPSDQVTKAIRSTISNTDALSIINHLRHSLAIGGYILRFTEEQQPPESPHKKIPPLSLPVIIDLLNATINAIGPSGWISAAGFASNQGSEATLVADMKTEVSAVLAGVEEATYLKGILREFIRCSETATGTQSASSVSRARALANNAPQQTTAGIKRKERHNGAEIEIYDQPNQTGGGAASSDVRALPLSLKLSEDQDRDGVTGGASAEPSKIKVLKSTGEVKTRSSREVNYLRRKAVGKYSFERIIV